MTAVIITPAHLDIVTALENEIYPDPWSKDVFAREIHDRHMINLLALDDAGAPMGYTFMRHIINEGHIENIGVLPECRRRGVASFLMDALLAEAGKRAMIGITLEVRQGNRAAMALYHKYGFIVSGYRREYYEDPKEDAVIMWKDLIL